jgi:hypothetical protein
MGAGEYIYLNGLNRIKSDDLQRITYDPLKFYNSHTSLIKRYLEILDSSSWYHFYSWSNGKCLYEFDLLSKTNEVITAVSLLRPLEESPGLVSKVLDYVDGDPEFILALIQCLMDVRNHALFNPLDCIGGHLSNSNDIAELLDLTLENSSVLLDPEKTYELPEAIIKKTLKSILPKPQLSEMLVERTIENMIPWITSGVWKEVKYA